jgi:hypothetical protein
MQNAFWVQNGEQKCDAKRVLGTERGKKVVCKMRFGYGRWQKSGMQNAFGIAKKGVLRGIISKTLLNSIKPGGFKCLWRPQIIISNWVCMPFECECKPAF